MKLASEIQKKIWICPSAGDLVSPEVIQVANAMETIKKARLGLNLKILFGPGGETGNPNTGVVDMTSGDILVIINGISGKDKFPQPAARTYLQFYGERGLPIFYVDHKKLTQSHAKDSTILTNILHLMDLFRSSDGESFKTYLDGWIKTPRIFKFWLSTPVSTPDELITKVAKDIIRRFKPRGYDKVEINYWRKGEDFAINKPIWESYDSLLILPLTPDKKIPEINQESPSYLRGEKVCVWSSSIPMGVMGDIQRFQTMGKSIPLSVVNTLPGGYFIYHSGDLDSKKNLFIYPGNWVLPFVFSAEKGGRICDQSIQEEGLVDEMTGPVNLDGPVDPMAREVVQFDRRILLLNLRTPN